MTMPIESGRLTVGTTAVQVDGLGVSPIRIYIHNEESTKTLYVGNGNVTTANGFGIDKSSVQDFLIFPGQSLWMVSESNGHVVSYLRIPV
jgi:hypothetical protein